MPQNRLYMSMMDDGCKTRRTPGLRVWDINLTFDQRDIVSLRVISINNKRFSGAYSETGAIFVANVWSILRLLRQSLIVSPLKQQERRLFPACLALDYKTATERTHVHHHPLP